MEYMSWNTPGEDGGLLQQCKPGGIFRSLALAVLYFLRMKRSWFVMSRQAYDIRFVERRDAV